MSVLLGGKKGAGHELYTRKDENNLWLEDDPIMITLLTYCIGVGLIAITVNGLILTNHLHLKTLTWGLVFLAYPLLKFLTQRFKL